MKEMCSNCKYNKYSRDSNGNRFHCGNEDSLEYGSPTDFDDVCEDWEAKED